jgi:hypothetical protein
MKPAARTAAFKFSVSAKSAAALRNSKKVLIRHLACGCAAALTLLEIKPGPGATDPAAGRLETLAPVLHNIRRHRVLPNVPPSLRKRGGAGLPT